MRIAITGGTGLIGTALRGHLAAGGHEAVAIRRGPESDPAAQWDPATGWVREGAFAGFGGVVHLSGASIGAGRWTDVRRETLRASRLDSTRTLVGALAALPAADRPSALVSQSAVGYYGERGEEELTEDAAPGTGFLAGLAVAWEGEARRAEDLGVRTVLHRSAIVLSREGPPLTRLLPPFRLGLGGNLGDGRWWMPWITLEDELRSIAHALTGGLEGPVNACAPEPARNADFTRALARALRRPALFPLPFFAYGLVFGQDPAELFASQRVTPKALADSGFAFSHPGLGAAFASLLG